LVSSRARSQAALMPKPQLTGRVLLIEDTRDVRTVIARLLAFNCSEVIECASGEDGLAAIREATPDLAIIDLGLPGISGFETLQAIRTDGHDFPCLALSGESTVANHTRWLELDGQGFVRKPVARRALEGHLRRWLEPMDKQTSATASLQSRFVSSMVESTSALRDAVKGRDLDRVMEIAHRMKGTCGAFRASELSSAAARVLHCVEAESGGSERLDEAFAEVAEAVARLAAQ